MIRIIAVVWVMIALCSCDGHSRGGDRAAARSSSAGGGKAAADSTWKDVRGNISFVFPAKGYAYEHRQELIQACLDAVPHDLRILHMAAFTDPFTIRFLDTRQEMRQYTGYPAGGMALPQPYMIIYYVVNAKEPGPPIIHEVMRDDRISSGGLYGAVSFAALWRWEGERSLATGV